MYSSVREHWYLECTVCGTGSMIKNKILDIGWAPPVSYGNIFNRFIVLVRKILLNSY